MKYLDPIQPLVLLRDKLDGSAPFAAAFEERQKVVQSFLGGSSKTCTRRPASHRKVGDVEVPVEIITKGPSGKGRDSLRGRPERPFTSPLVSNIIHATWYRSTEGVLNGSGQELYLDTTRASTIVVMTHNFIYALRVADPKNAAPLWVDEIAVPRARMRNLTVEAIQLVTQTDRVVPPNLTWTCLPQSGSVRPPPRFSTSNAGVPLLRYKTVLFHKPRLIVERTTRVGACGKHAAMCAMVPSVVCERVVTKAGAWSSPEAVFADAMHRAKVLVVDSSHHMMYFTRFGEGEIQRVSGYPLDALIQLAMQLAYYRIHGRTAPVYETTLRRSFSSGCTETIRGRRLAEAVEGRDIDDAPLESPLSFQSLCFVHMLYPPVRPSQAPEPGRPGLWNILGT
ncbi:hypothetical protein M404DRAFT_10329 [Pisolithus tinctorius Marx 270]|uniref:Choline/carnitine acyltransferase domain-containing protein n=1 Tax=Pisolithus tinctorius Marx 270 TaxID=870435 RepID=A0A0C3ISA5_PISTI|nr:hypothetical protein M404DRAFT_10329 [Pisolithus tinctorius Marx 270]